MSEELPAHFHHESYCRKCNEPMNPHTPDNVIALNTGSPQDRAIVRELIHLRSPNLEFRSHERDSNYRWEKIKYGTGATEINWAYLEFRLLGCMDAEPATQISK